VLIADLLLGTGGTYVKRFPGNGAARSKGSAAEGRKQ